MVEHIFITLSDPRVWSQAVLITTVMICAVHVCKAKRAYEAKKVAAMLLAILLSVHSALHAFERAYEMYGMKNAEVARLIIIENALIL
jgi:hypothetical protein